MAPLDLEKQDTGTVGCECYGKLSKLVPVHRRPSLYGPIGYRHGNRTLDVYARRIEQEMIRKKVVNQ